MPAKDTTSESKPSADNPAASRRSGDLFIVDNSDTDWKVLDYLREWSDIAKSVDIAGSVSATGSAALRDTHLQPIVACDASAHTTVRK